MPEFLHVTFNLVSSACSFSASSNVKFLRKKLPKQSWHCFILSDKKKESNEEELQMIWTKKYESNVV